MTFQLVFYVASLLATLVLSGFMAFYAWRHRQITGARFFTGLALAEWILAFSEIMSVFAPSMSQALFWFEIRYPASMTISIFWLMFALEYSERKDWLSKPFLSGLLIVPIIAQAMLWSNNLHHLWLKQEAGFTHIGMLWMADISARQFGPGFLLHMFYAILLVLFGIFLLLLKAWKMRLEMPGQALLVAGAGFTALIFTANSIFNFLPKTAFNLFTPGIGLSVILIALAIFYFDFLKSHYKQEAEIQKSGFKPDEKHSLANLILIFILFTAGLAAASYLAYKSFENQFRKQVEGQLSSIADLKVGELVNWRNERKANAETIRNNPTFIALVQRLQENPGDQQAREQLQVWLNLLCNSYGYDEAFLVDTKSIVWISSPIGLDAMDPHLINEVPLAVKSGQVSLLDFHRHSSDRSIHLGLLVPIRAENRPLGALILRINPETYLYPLIQRWPMPNQSGETLLVRREGSDVLFLNELKFQQDVALNLRIPLMNKKVPAVMAVLGQTGIVEGTDYRGQQVIADIRPVPDTPWFLVSKMDTAEVYVPLHERLRQTIFFFMVLTLAGGTVLALFWRQQQIRYFRSQIETATALQESEEKFSKIFNNAPVWIAITDLGTEQYLEINEQALYDTGFSREDVIKHTAMEVGWVNEEDMAQATHEIQNFGRIFGLEMKFHAKNGRTLYGWVSGEQMMMGGKSCLLIVVVNITERKKSEELLEHERNLLRTLIENLPDSVFIKDLASRVIVDNAAHRHLLGVTSPEQSVGKTDFDFFPAHLAATYRADEEQIIQSGNPLINKEEAHTDKEGNNRWLLTAKIPWRDRNGTITGIVGINHDITERRRAENELRESERKLKEAQKMAHLGFWSWDIKTGHVEWSEEVFKIFCLDPKEFTPHIDTILALSPWPEDHQRDKELIEYAIQSHTPGSYEQKFLRPDQSIGHYYSTFQGNYDENGELVSIVGTVLDTTERKKAEDALQNYNSRLEAEVEERTRELHEVQEQLVRQERLATMGQLAGSIGHELRNPLGVITNAVYFLKASEPNASDKVKEYLDIIEKETRTSDKIITDLLDFTRIKSLDLQPATVSELIRQSLERFPPPESVGVTLNIPPDLPQIYVDPQHVIQTFINLISNACQAMTSANSPNVGKLTVSASKLGDMIKIEVQDTGAGISPENMKRLFEPLFTTKTKGIGLGLAVSRKLTEANGGRIEVQSQLGKGSIFTVYLPVHLEEKKWNQN